MKMAIFGYHASHEQFAPDEMLACVRAAEAAGFDAAMSSDHFAPWSARQGQSGFAWAWLGAAMQATKLPFGIVTSPIGFRYHPAIIAQAGATLAGMFPDRFWLAAGSGEALNERVVGGGWPGKQERDERLLEAISIVECLWRGEEVTRAAPIPVEGARIYSLAPRPPPLFAAALTPETARWAASWADGLITINQPWEKLRPIVEAFREAGGEGRPLYLQVHLSWARNEEEARANAHDQWRSNALPGSVAAELKSPQMFDEATRFVRPEDLAESVRISADPNRQAEWIAEDLAHGFDAVFLHNVGRNQREFIDVVGDKVLPALRRSH